MKQYLFASPYPKGRRATLYEEIVEVGYSFYVLYRQLVESTPLRRLIKVNQFSGGQFMCIYTKENIAALKKYNNKSTK